MSRETSPPLTTESKCRRQAPNPGDPQDDISAALLSPAAGLFLSISPASQSAGYETAADQDQTAKRPEKANPSKLRFTDGDSTRADDSTARDLNSQSSRSSRTAGNMRPVFRINDEPLETTALLADDSSQLSQKHPGISHVTKDWEEADENVGTTSKEEFLILIKYSLPLMLSCVLQYSLTGASVVAVGHLGKAELGAVSLATMTSNVTGYCAFEGFATSLDTLCAQAYGSGKPHLVGLHLQRLVYFLWIITIPIAAVWLCGTQILLLITPERECAELAGLYLKILVLGAPGFALFEAGKRFLQAQGIFNANLYVLLMCAPLNAFMNWLFVWHFNWGFAGAPAAVVVTHNLLPLCLWLYVYFVDGMQCWNGFTRKAFRNWAPMIQLAVPGYVMVISEFLAFEVLTLASSHLSNTALAAQSVLATLSIITFQIPFPISIAASTRLANLIGAGLPGASRVCIHVTLAMACCAGAFNMVMLTTLRNYIPRVFTSDPAVTDLIVRVIPLFAAFQLFDALVANCCGVLRGMGRQKIGGWVNVICYYGIAIPVSLVMAFGLRWGLFGLWMGPAVGLFLVSTIEWWYIYQSNWRQIIEAAFRRNEFESC